MRHLKYFVCATLMALLHRAGCAQPSLPAGPLEVVPLTSHTYLHVSYLETESWGRVACNGLVVVNEGEALVLDTPVDEAASEQLLSWIRDTLKAEVRAVVATHFHNDCLGGLGAFHRQGIASYALEATRTLARAQGYVVPQQGFGDSLVLSAGRLDLRLLYPGAGHTRDNIVAYLPEDRVLFGGCLVKALGAGKGNLADADTGAWPATVQKVMDSFPELRWVVPGHGEPGGPELLSFTSDLFLKPE